MDRDLVRKVTWLSDRFTEGPVRSIVLRFGGLGGGDMRSGADLMELEWCTKGGLVVVPFANPWAWMNDATREFVDELVDGVRDLLGLPATTPVISTGGSIGGHAALIYPLYSRQPVKACLAQWPVCDLPFHYGERADLPRTMHSAYGSYGDITDRLERNSPVHQAARLPRIPYCIVHGAADQAVAKGPHSDRLVALLRAGGHQVEYLEDPDMGHGGPMTWRIARRMTDFVSENLAEG